MNEAVDAAAKAFLRAHHGSVPVSLLSLLLRFGLDLKAFNHASKTLS